jgi:hypothetical protein
MAIDRGPWNALVDDDGSNLTGTVWNKDKIKTVLLDPMDAALAPSWITVPYNAANFTASSGTWTVTAGNQGMFRYTILGGKTVVLNISIGGSTISGATPVRLKITLPAAIQSAVFFGGFMPMFYAITTSGPMGVSGLATMESTYIDVLRDVAGTAWPLSTSGVYLYIQAVYPIAL